MKVARAILLLLAAAPAALAQCAMCRANTAGLDARGLGALNSGILVLLVPPVVLVGAIFVIAFCRSTAGIHLNAKNAEAQRDLSASSAPPRALR